MMMKQLMVHDDETVDNETDKSLHLIMGVMMMLVMMMMMIMMQMVVV